MQIKLHANWIFILHKSTSVARKNDHMPVVTNLNLTKKQFQKSMSSLQNVAGMKSLMEWNIQCVVTANK